MANSIFGNRTLPAGGGTAIYIPSGVLTVSTTQAGTPASTEETDLWTYTLPANTLSQNHAGLRITVWGGTATNGNTKTIRQYFGASVLTVNASTAAPNNNTWRAQYTVIRTGAATEQFLQQYSLVGSTGQFSVINSATEDTAGAIVIRITGQNGTAQANDIVFRGAIVEFLPAPVS